jgi:uncharacterized lipoprotein YddW (UPF0748 family)
MKRSTFISTLCAFFAASLCVALLPEPLPAQATVQITSGLPGNTTARTPADVSSGPPEIDLPLPQTQVSDLHPNRGTDPEFRGAWIATVANLDWPASPDDTPEKQKADLVRQLEILKQTGFNAVFFQVRTECDALYDSPFEPWSHYLTGKQGDAPFPLWDPLEFAIQESHKRGMELHAWLNPYRTARQEGLYPVADDHITKTRPDLLLRFRGRSYTSSILDPGNPKVVDYIARITADIVRRYDVDGIHFDDYFYPYQNPAQNFPGITGEDAETFRKFNRGIADIGDWRRDNINLMVAAVHDSIKAVKPHVKFGVSPFGIWKDNVPAGIRGSESYGGIFADPLAWLEQGKVDYMLPQLYWAFGGEQDYEKLSLWWARETGSRHMYSGLAVYKKAMRKPDGSPLFGAGEIPDQVDFNRANPAIRGHVMFRAGNITDHNLAGIRDSLSERFSRPVLTPAMDWIVAERPPAPLEPEWFWNAERNGLELRWEQPDHSTGRLFYAVYRYDTAFPLEPGVILDRVDGPVHITGEHGFFTRLNNPACYIITSVGYNSAQSEPTSPLCIYPKLVYGDQAVLQTEPVLYLEPGADITYSFTLNDRARVRAELFTGAGESAGLLIDEVFDPGNYAKTLDQTLIPGVNGYYIVLESGGIKRLQHIRAKR